MFERAVRKIVNEIIKEKYPHSLVPNIIYAKIVNKRIEGNSYLYSLKKVNSYGVDDILYSIIPNVKSEHNFEINNIVVAACVEGNSENVYIIGRKNR